MQLPTSDQIDKTVALIKVHGVDEDDLYRAKLDQGRGACHAEYINRIETQNAEWRVIIARLEDLKEYLNTKGVPE